MYSGVVWVCVLLTVNSQREALCKEGFGLLCLCHLAWVEGVLGHQFEEVKEELVKVAASLKILGIMGAQLEINQKSSQYCDNNLMWLFSDIKAHALRGTYKTVCLCTLSYLSNHKSKPVKQNKHII